MFTLVSVNYSTRHFVFYVDSEEDLDSLPTQTRSGKGTLQTVGSCAMGSIAKCANGNNYILNGEDEWVIYTPQLKIPRITTEDIMLLFNNNN